MSNEQLLFTVWNTSLVLGVLGLGLLLFLILRRSHENHIQRKRDQFQNEMTRRLGLVLAGRHNALEMNYTPLQMDMLVDSAAQISLTIRGPMLEKLLDALKGIGLPDIVRRIAAKVNHPARLSAIRLLGLWQEPSDQQNMLRWLIESQQPMIRLALAEALCRNTNTSLHNQLFGELRKNNLKLPLPVTVRLLQSLGSAKPVRENILSLASNRKADQLARIASLHVLGSHKLCRSSDLIPLLGEKKPDIRAQVAASLAHFKEDKVVNELHRLLADKEWHVRARTAEALGKIGNPKSLKLLTDCLHDKAWWVRFRAAKALLSLGRGGEAVLRVYAGENNTGSHVAQLVLKEVGRHV